MGYAEGDPFPCTGFETPGAILRLNEDGTPQGNDTAILASACCADWYLGPGRWVWRDGDPDVRPVPENPAPADLPPDPPATSSPELSAEDPPAERP